MHRKWVKLWRRAQDTLIPHAYRWQLFTWLLVTASHKPRVHTCRRTGHSIPLKPGQLVIAGRLLAKKLNRPRVSIQRDLNWMVEQKMIRLQRMEWGTLVTIRNWKLYQNPDQATEAGDVDEALVQKVMADLNAQLDAYKVTAAGRVKGGERFTRAVMSRVHQDGASLEQFRHVHQVKCAEWAGTDMERYLRPSTLYAPKHWEEYLGQGAVTQKEWKPRVVGEDERKGP